MWNSHPGRCSDVCGESTLLWVLCMLNWIQRAAWILGLWAVCLAGSMTSPSTLAAQTLDEPAEVGSAEGQDGAVAGSGALDAVMGSGALPPNGAATGATLNGPTPVSSFIKPVPSAARAAAVQETPVNARGMTPKPEWHLSTDWATRRQRLAYHCGDSPTGQRGIWGRQFEAWYVTAVLIAMAVTLVLLGLGTRLIPRRTAASPATTRERLNLLAGASVTLVLLLYGVGVVGAIGASIACQAEFFSAVAAGFAALSAALAVGIIVGLLFTMPEQLHSVRTGARSGPQGSTWDGAASLGRVAQISDWLTKVLLGAGLTQIDQIVLMLKALAREIDDASGYPAAVLVALICTGTITGVLVGMVATWVYLPVVMEASRSAAKDAAGQIRYRIVPVDEAGLDEAKRAEWKERIAAMPLVRRRLANPGDVVNALVADAHHPLVRDLGADRAKYVLAAFLAERMDVRAEVDTTYSMIASAENDAASHDTPAPPDKSSH
jgi:hypothetical protein